MIRKLKCYFGFHRWIDCAGLMYGMVLHWSYCPFCNKRTPMEQRLN